MCDMGAPDEPWEAPTESAFFGQQFGRRVEKHTAEARAKFQSSLHLERDNPDRFYWLAVLNEEVGKLTRACNKLAIAEAPDVKQQWRAEGRHRLLTVASMARRMAEAWDAIPDSPAVGARSDTETKA